MYNSDTLVYDYVDGDPVKLNSNLLVHQWMTRNPDAVSFYEVESDKRVDASDLPSGARLAVRDGRRRRVATVIKTSRGFKVRA